MQELSLIVEVEAVGVRGVTVVGVVPCAELMLYPLSFYLQRKFVFAQEERVS